MGQTNPNGPILQHLALMVRDIEASHRFYTGAVGFEQCGKLGDKSRSGSQSIDFRFYRGAEDRHHDLALVQIPDPSAFPPANTEWQMVENKVGINHLAICYPSREDFLERLQALRDLGVESRQRGNHGMTHSVYVSDPDGNGVEFLYELPEEVWVDNVNAAPNYWEPMSTEGDDSLEDSTDYHRFVDSST
ncbi:MAG: VOC family protein [Actinomycetota bacterium]|nr:VOC family protein [Actinomycetota bacterium]